MEQKNQGGAKGESEDKLRRGQGGSGGEEEGNGPLSGKICLWSHQRPDMSSMRGNVLCKKRMEDAVQIFQSEKRIRGESSLCGK